MRPPSTTLLTGLSAYCLVVGAAAICLATEPGGQIVIPDCNVSVGRQAALAFDRAGIVSGVDVAAGDEITQSQVMARIRDDLARATVQSISHELQNDVELRFARKAADLARLEYEKILQLNAEIPNAHSELTVRGKKLTLERALLQIEQETHRQELGQFRLAEAQLALSLYQLRAPFDGVVLRVHKTVGEAAQQGETVLEIADVHTMLVEGYVPLEQARQVRRGAAVALTIDSTAGRGEPRRTNFSGQVVFIEPALQELRNTVLVRARVSNENGRLLAGMTGTMVVGLPSRSQAGFTRQP